MITQFLLILALVLFLCAGAGVPSGRWNLIAFGLAAWVAASIFGKGLL